MDVLTMKMFSNSATTLEKTVAATLIGVALTAISYGTGMGMGWIDSINWLEVFSVFTSYSCTYLCVKQSRTNYIWGVISVAALSLLFYQAGLYSSMALNMYLLPTLVWGWFRWGRDTNTRPVMWVSWKWWPVYVGLSAIVWYGLVTVSTMMGATLPLTDSFILAASVLAQFLLDQKKIENWMVWFVVNVVAIYTYWTAGLVLVAFQYIFFLLNTFWGFYDWKRTMRNA